MASANAVVQYFTPDIALPATCQRANPLSFNRTIRTYQLLRQRLSDGCHSLPAFLSLLHDVVHIEGVLFLPAVRTSAIVTMTTVIAIPVTVFSWRVSSIMPVVSAFSVSITSWVTAIGSIATLMVVSRLPTGTIGTVAFIISTWLCFTPSARSFWFGVAIVIWRWGPISRRSMTERLIVWISFRFATSTGLGVVPRWLAPS